MCPTRFFYKFFIRNLFYDTANSNNIQLAMNFGLSKVKSLFMNMTSSNKLNNLGEDSFATLPPTNLDGTLAGVQKVTRKLPKLFWMILLCSVIM